MSPPPRMHKFTQRHYYLKKIVVNLKNDSKIGKKLSIS